MPSFLEQRASLWPEGFLLQIKWCSDLPLAGCQLGGSFQIPDVMAVKLGAGTVGLLSVLNLLFFLSPLLLPLFLFPTNTVE